MFWQRSLARAGMVIPRFLLGSKNRTKIKYLAATIPPWERDLYKNNPRVDPWAFIRVHNEARTILQSLNSIKGIIHKGVIAFHGSTDGTEEIVYDFCKENKGFIPYRYPHEVVPCGDPRYEGNVPYENTLAAYYNATLDLIPKGEWFIKVDGDLLCFPDILEKSFHIPTSEKDCVIYSRLDLLFTENKLMAHGYRRPGDHWLIRKDDETRFENIKVIRDGKLYGYEILNKGKRRIICTECSWLHFPFEKQWRSTLNAVDRYNLGDFLKQLPDYEIDKSRFTVENLEAIYRQIIGVQK